MTRNSPRGAVSGTAAVASARTDAADHSLRRLLAFAAVSVFGGGTLFALSTLVEPGGAFILAGVYLALAAPALVLTHRESGREGVRRLLRDCVRPPRSWWWLPIAGLTLPVAAWAVAAPLGGTRQITADFLVLYLLDLVIGLLLVNMWEEMAWTGYFQRRAITRWGTIAGSLVTALFFTAIHLPLAFAGVDSVSEAGHNLAVLAGVAVGVRVVIAHLDRWTGSLMVIGLFHSSFNATEAALRTSHDWVRVAVVVAVGVFLAAVSHRGEL